MFEEKERKRKDNVHVTEARAGVCNLAVEDEEKGENRDNQGSVDIEKCLLKALVMEHSGL